MSDKKNRMSMSIFLELVDATAYIQMVNGNHAATNKAESIMLTFTDHNGTVHNFADLPETSQQAFVNRAVSHIFGNECASTVTAWKKTDEGANASEDAISVKLTEARNAKLEKILAGTLGVRAVGPRIDPLEREMDRIALREIKAFFAKQGWKFPKADETFAFGADSFTADELADRWLDGTDRAGDFGKAGEANKPRIERAAKRVIAEKAKMVKPATAAPVPQSLGEALGF